MGLAGRTWRQTVYRCRAARQCSAKSHPEAAARRAVPKASEAADKTDDAGADKAVKEPKTTAEKEADYKKRKLEQAEKDKKAGEEAKRKESNDENCARAKSYLQSLKSGVRITSTDSNGERSYLSDDDRIKEKARAEEAINASCDK